MTTWRLREQPTYGNRNYEHGQTHDTLCHKCGEGEGMRCAFPDGKVRCEECLLAHWDANRATVEKIREVSGWDFLAGRE